jgi:hypothetical protein
MPILDQLRIFCVQLEGEDRSERFVMGAFDSTSIADSLRVSQPLIESDMRDELRGLGFSDEVIQTGIEKARSFKTTTTTREWWSWPAAAVSRARP